jgi:hypothetical protein
VPLMPRVTAEDLAAHRAFVATLGENAIWRDYLSESDDEIPTVPLAVVTVVGRTPAVAAHP